MLSTRMESKRPASSIVVLDGRHAHRQDGEYVPFALPAPAKQSLAYTVTKRMLDVFVGAVGFVVSLPVMAALAVAIRIDSPGPIIFRQKRVGEGGKLFTFYKFRTMYVDARERFPDLYAYRYTDDEIRTMYFKIAEDPRLTPIGARLRRTSLDELPNLINVLRGDMSLVGPRPEIPEMLAYYEPHQLVKFTMKPGVTGLAQVSGRSLLRFRETNEADVEYFHRASFWFDLVILMRTVKCVILRVGAF